MSRSRRASIALINPLGDYGIGAYTYELAEGLSKAGATVDVFTTDGAPIAAANLPMQHAMHTVLGSFLFKSALARSWQKQTVTSQASSSHSAVSKEREAAPGKAGLLLSRLKNLVLTAEFALYLKARGYDLVWTQWPYLDRYGILFWQVCRSLGFPIVHTVHNVLSHEKSEQDIQHCGEVYRYCDLLIVHSRQSQEELERIFPETKNKIVVAAHGLYSMYPRLPEARDPAREALNIAKNQTAILFYGGVRPYKNLDAVLEPLADASLENCVLVVAGRESAYDDMVPGDPLGRTRRLAEKWGVLSKLRLCSGYFSIEQTAELFEAADIVVLPYIESYGSGVLLLAMTYGKHVVVTPTGGMEEHVEGYSKHTVVKGFSSKDVLQALRSALTQQSETLRPECLATLQWPVIAASLLNTMEAKFGVKLRATAGA